jgi:hypothetical protein
MNDRRGDLLHPWDEGVAAPADHRTMASSTRHAFRYELTLCSLVEGETLRRRRPEDAAEADARKDRGGLRARLGLRARTARARAAR